MNKVWKRCGEWYTTCSHTVQGEQSRAPGNQLCCWTAAGDMFVPEPLHKQSWYCRCLPIFSSKSDIKQSFNELFINDPPRIASPACTELEMVMMDWLGRMLKLPDHFLFSGQNSSGGGVIQCTASEATLVALLSARTKAIEAHKALNPGKYYPLLILDF